MSLIYKIYCKDPNIKECYVGSTNNLHRRKTQHKECSSNINSKHYNSKVYTFIRANGGFENFDFMILEQFETVINKNDLLKIERKYIEDEKKNLNTTVPIRTIEEKKNSNYIYNTQYRKTHKTQFTEYKKQEYQRHKEEIKKKSKEYYEHIKEKLKEKIVCECCKNLVRKDNLKRHQNTKKCLSFKYN